MYTDSRFGRVARMASTLVAAAVLASIVATGALGAPGPSSPGTSPQQPPQPSYPSCATVAPDAVFYVPSVFGSKTIASGGAAYFYEKDGCSSFVVDVKMATYSNTQDNPNYPPTPLLLSAGPYDLPSSSAKGGHIPTTAEDCGRLQVWARYYLKKSNESSFKQLGWHSGGTKWENGSCKYWQAGEHAAWQSDSGWDTYRVAVSVKLRNSGQEAGVFLNQAPPA